MTPNPDHRPPDRDETRRHLAQIGAHLAEGGAADPFAAAVRHTRMPIVISDPGQADNPIVFANDSFCRLTGYDRADIVGRNCRFLQGEGTSKAVVAKVREAVRQGLPIETDIRNYRRDGTPFWNHMMMTPVRDAGGRVVFFIASQVDVTLERDRLVGLENHNEALLAELSDRLAAQAASEARLLMATEAGRLGIWELCLRTGALTTSQAARRIFGRDPGQPFAYAELLAQIHPGDRSRVEAVFSGTAQLGEGQAGAGQGKAEQGGGYDVEYRVIRPDGSIGWVQLRAEAQHGPDGTPLRVAGVSLDVTDRKSAEQRLELSEESLRLATDAAEIGTWDLDIVSGELNWSDRTKAMFGLPAGALCSMDDFYAGLHPDDLDVTSLAFARAVDPALRLPYDVEYRTVGPADGVVRWVAARGRALFDAQGACVRALGTAIDITDRRAEAARQAFLLGLLDRLRALTDPGEIMRTAVTALGRQLDISRAGYGHVQADGATARLETGYAAAQEALVGTLRMDMLGARALEHLRQGTVLAVADLAALGDVGGWNVPRTRAFVAVPLLRDGVLSAFLFVGHRDARAWPSAELRLIGDVAARTWDAVARARAEAEVRHANAALERQVAERTAALRTSEERMRAVFETSYQLKGLLSLDGTVLDMNATALAVIDAAADAVMGRPYWDTPWFTATPGMPEQVRAAVQRAAGGQETRRQIILQVQGVPRSYDLSVRPIRDGAGQVVAILPEAIDITERRDAEEQLRQAQKMEAVGHLTGGIAHDFNNLLTGIVGSLELLQRRVAEGRTDGLARYAGAATAAAQRAAALTQRLLAFARRQPLDPKPVDANRLLAGMEDLLARTLGAGVRLHMAKQPDLWQALSDPNQLENAILNLAINARDAMPQGGALDIVTSNVVLDGAYARAHGDEMRPGDYVMVSIRDTGEGMTPDVLAKAFDPFFTTKPIGKGTGLGLSMLYGFIKQSKGHVRVHSVPGEGSLFELFLPRADAAVARPSEAGAPAEIGGQHGAGETVLVVEDEATVRMLVIETLRELGYAALEAHDGPAGLALLQSGARVDLLVTDVGLPGLNGRQLAEAGRLLRPGLRVLFMTGYAHNAAVGQGDALDPGMQIISKPFALDALSARIRQMIESPAEHPSS